VRVGHGESNLPKWTAGFAYRDHSLDVVDKPASMSMTAGMRCQKGDNPMLNDSLKGRIQASFFCGLIWLPACDGENVEPELVDDRDAEITHEAVDSEYQVGDVTWDDLATKIVGPVLAFEPEDVDDFYIESISTGGSGCPDSYTVTPVIADDRRSFLLIFDEMFLEYPPGPRVKNKTCSAGVKLHVPGGYQVALATVNTRGYAYLDKGMRARHTSKYFFAGNPIAFAPHATLKGPFDDLYDFADYVPFESLVWSPCGGEAIFGIQSILNLNAVHNPHGQAIFSNDTIDGQFQQLYHLHWKECDED
jgi:hypothetical protein